LLLKKDVVWFVEVLATMVQWRTSIVEEVIKRNHHQNMNLMMMLSQLHNPAKKKKSASINHKQVCNRHIKILHWASYI
jgi:hypothetical protein